MADVAPPPAPSDGGNPSLSAPSTPSPAISTDPGDIVAQVVEVDWPPATPQGPSDPADTPGAKDVDDLFPATEGTTEMDDAS